MPSAVTQTIYDGETTFEDFALRCARLIGFLGRFKDEPLDMPLPETIEPNPYYGTEYANARVFLQAIETMSSATAERRAQADYLVAFQRYQLKLAAVRERRSRCEAMLAQVHAWQPPTPEHEALKMLMAQQLKECIVTECHTDYLKEPQLLSGEIGRASCRERV